MITAKILPVPSVPVLYFPHIVHYATLAHEGQVRKYTGEPYIEHPLEVARMVAKCQHITPEMMAAAVLHDVVEDCHVPLQEIDRVFGINVYRLVESLTDVSRPEDGNRAARKQIDWVHTEQACPDAKTIKLADLISNTRSIVAHDPGFAKIYMEEKAQLLSVLWQGDERLYNCALSLLEEYQTTGTIDPAQFQQGGSHAEIL